VIPTDKKRIVDTVDLSIDASTPGRIVEQMQQQPNLYAYYAEQLEEAKYRTAEVKTQIEQRKAEIAKTLRDSDPKISEAKIEKVIPTYPDMGVLHSAYNQIKLEEGKLQVLVKALEHRMSVLMTICALRRQELRQFGASDVA